MVRLPRRFPLAMPAAVTFQPFGLQAVRLPMSGRRVNTTGSSQAAKTHRDGRTEGPATARPAGKLRDEGTRHRKTGG